MPLPTASGFFNQRQRPQSRQSDTDVDANVSLDLSSILPFVSMIKSQVRDIISELALQVFEYVRNIAQNFKVRLLRKLGKYTLSDVFHLMFDGVVDFVKDEAEMSEKPNVAENNVTENTTKKINEEDQIDNDSNNKEEPSGNFILDNTYPWTIYTQ
ncbi:hypothetical protein RR46_06591 [Papilio xuthus]|nr:hypothetical protein RR46_06591 [Papilio xuthus]